MPSPAKRLLDRLLLVSGGALVLASVAVVGCGGSGAQEEQSAGGAPSKSGAVTIKGFAYAPKDITVAAGSKVTWTNQDSAAHTASATESGGFDTGGLDKGKKKTVTLDKPGTYPYICEFHPTMKGTVTVK